MRLPYALLHARWMSFCKSLFVAADQKPLHIYKLAANYNTTINSSSNGFRKASTQPTNSLNQAVLDEIAALIARQGGIRKAIVLYNTYILIMNIKILSVIN
ncbi:hypothetical protein NIES4071_09170 [Calothrix sp. NIES-4071]|nr:hypothetical protein NIES4071_09170 [Calothrix sp. NIES-4071]BAZ55259.1 hypothetical protein NIES4105_09130 [Calothrix sp. NIES-4105]